MKGLLEVTGIATLPLGSLLLVSTGTVLTALVTQVNTLYRLETANVSASTNLLSVILSASVSVPESLQLVFDLTMKGDGAVQGFPLGVMALVVLLI